MDLSKAIVWNVASFNDGKTVDVSLDDLVIGQTGLSQNDDLVKILVNDKTRCWQPEADCSPPSTVLRKTSFIEKFGSMMRSSWGLMKKKHKHSQANTNVDLDSLGRLLAAESAAGRNLKSLYLDGRRLGFKKFKKAFKKIGKKVGGGLKKVGKGIQKLGKKIGKAFKKLTRRKKKRVMH